MNSDRRVSKGTGKRGNPEMTNVSKSRCSGGASHKEHMDPQLKEGGG